ncbi:hypothetical protein [Paenibacillus sp. SI8]|uniref:hypothetical protein n=1 Tax=unclassified Paenibacillus TaxID=185978 RepID=UPI0034671803
MARSKLTAEQRKDWRNITPEKWNARTVQTMCIDLNRELYGIEQYVPYRNWAAEQAIIKRNLTQYGADVLREVFDEAFREYRPTREYPQLTAGFVLSYVASRILPRVLADKEARERRAAAEEGAPSAGEVTAWL